MPPVKLMTNLLPDLYAFIKHEAKVQKKTMREIIEEAISVYKREKRKEKMRQDSQRLAQDQEYLRESVELAEMGMEDYFNIIQRGDSEI